MPAKTDPALIERIRALYESGMCSREIAPIIGKSAKAIQQLAQDYNLPRPKQGGAVGKWSGQWKGGRTIDKHGYVLIMTKDHPFCNSGGYVREHRLVMEEHLKRFLMPQEVVHHIDGNKQNNAIENLQFFAKNSEHLKYELTGKCPKWTSQGLDRMLEAGRRWRAQEVAANRMTLRTGVSK